MEKEPSNQGFIFSVDVDNASVVQAIAENQIFGASPDTFLAQDSWFKLRKISLVLPLTFCTVKYFCCQFRACSFTV